MNCTEQLTFNQALLLIKIMLGSISVVAFLMALIAKLLKDDRAANIMLSIAYGFVSLNLLFWSVARFIEGKWL